MEVVGKICPGQHPDARESHDLPENRAENLPFVPVKGKVESHDGNDPADTVKELRPPFDLPIPWFHASHPATLGSPEQ